MGPLPAAERTARHRARVLWTIRGLAAMLVIAGLYLIVNRIAFGFFVRPVQIAWTHYQGVGEGHLFSHGIAMLAIGAALAMSSRRLARWVAVMPEHGCPACGYTGEHDDAGRCPECGSHLGPPKP